MGCVGTGPLPADHRSTTAALGPGSSAARAQPGQWLDAPAPPRAPLARPGAPCPGKSLSSVPGPRTRPPCRGRQAGAGGRFRQLGHSAPGPGSRQATGHAPSRTPQAFWEAVSVSAIRWVISPGPSSGGGTDQLLGRWRSGHV